MNNDERIHTDERQEGINRDRRGAREETTIVLPILND